jgi:hypothetical protein
MRQLRVFSLLFSAAVLAACATPAEPDFNPQKLNDTPDLSAFQRIEISSNASRKRESAPSRYIANGAYLDVQFPGASNQRLYVQVEECRDSRDAYCPRRYVLTGDLAAFSSQLKCYVQIRNDANSGYLDQALQGLCQDQFRRSYSITISK